MVAGQPQETLSVVVPTLNEAVSLPALLASLRAQQGVDLEIIVADGGSTDATPEIAIAAGATVVRTERGRGRQMNAAARRARGKYLLFLHADSGIDDPRLLEKALAALAACDDDRAAGHFRLRFVRRSDRHRLAWRYVEGKTAFNRPYTTNGDQGFLLTRRFFEELGGFDESLPFLEDQRLAEKIRALGTWITLPGLLNTSARRFESEGFHRRYLLMAIVMGLHAAGVETFFRRAPQVYRVQHETGRLRLTPFFRLIGAIQRERGLRESVKTWLRVGRFVRENAWQVFYFVDVVLEPLWGRERYPALALHDRIARPLRRCRICDAMVAGLTLLWVMGVFRLWFRLVEDQAAPSPTAAP